MRDGWLPSRGARLRGCWPHPTSFRQLSVRESGRKSRLQIMAQPRQCPGEAKKSNTCAIPCAICRNGIFGNSKDI